MLNVCSLPIFLRIYHFCHLIFLFADGRLTKIKLRVAISFLNISTKLSLLLYKTTLLIVFCPSRIVTFSISVHIAHHDIKLSKNLHFKLYCTLSYFNFAFQFTMISFCHTKQVKKCFYFNYLKSESWTKINGSYELTKTILLFLQMLFLFYLLVILKSSAVLKTYF